MGNKRKFNAIVQKVLQLLISYPEYDFVIIGSGPGGSTIAGRLAEAKLWKILVLEAGDDEPVGTQVPSFHKSFLNSSIDWRFKTEPELVGCQGLDEKRCPWPRGKVLGGSSVINGAMFVRATSYDFQRWVDAGNTDWSHDKVLPYFKSYEDARETNLDEGFHGIGGPVTIQRYRDQPPIAADILQAAREIGYTINNDINGKNPNGFAIAPMITRDGTRLSLAKAFLRPQRNNPKLHVMLNSTVTKIVITEENNKKIASEVNFVYKNQTFVVKVGKEVIVCAGAVQTPHILLLSGIGEKKLLNSFDIKQVHDLPAVGKGLQNHVSFRVTASLARPDTNILNAKTLSTYLKNQTGPMSSTGLAQVVARLSTKYTTPDDPDLQFYFSGYLANCATTGVPGEPNDLERPVTLRNISFFPTYVQTKSKGYIGLHSNNPFDAPKIVANYLTEKGDVDGLVAGIRIAQKLINSTILSQKYGMRLVKETYGNCAKHHRWDSDDFWACAVKYLTEHENHQGSSCKMGPKSDPEACVNQKLQLHGIDNIRIMDASAFPTPPSANPQATIIMMAERGAHFIRELYSEV